MARQGDDDNAQDVSVDRWSWLAGTYWYVPTEYLLAIEQKNVRSPSFTQVQDQTLWYFTEYTAGYLIGQCAASIDGGDLGYQSIVGSVTPDGDVRLSFSPVGGVDLSLTKGVSTDSFIIGQGRMTKHKGQWAFLMQMTAGSAAANLSHWAYMMQTKPGDPSWTNIPGLPDTSVDDAFADWG